MADFKTMTTPWATIFSDNETPPGDFSPCTGWMDAADVDTVRISFEVAGTTDGSGIVKPGFQCANVPSSADAASTITSVNSQTGNGYSFPAQMFDISATTNTKQLVRFHYWFSVSSAGIKACRVTGRWQVKKN